MPITLEQAKNLKHHSVNKNADGTCQRWKVNGKPKTWKTRPDEVKVPVKQGQWMYDYVTHKELHLVHLAERCPEEESK